MLEDFTFDVQDENASNPETGGRMQNSRKKLTGLLVVLVIIGLSVMWSRVHKEKAPVATYKEEGTVKSGLAIDTHVEGDIKTGKPVEIDFFVNQKPEGGAIDDLQQQHEKYIHVVGVRDDLTHFFHIHPERVSAGHWKVKYTFTEAGRYKFFSDVVEKGVTYAFGHTPVVVSGTPTKAQEPEEVQFLNNIIIGKEYQMELEKSEPLVKGKPMVLVFNISDVFGNGFELEPYLGAQMHLSVVKDDLSEYIHAHPDTMEPHMHSAVWFVPDIAYAHTSVDPNAPPIVEVPFDVTFPKAGVYKLFAQFRPKGSTLPQDQALIGEFYVKVEEKGVSKAPAGHEIK